LSTDAGTARGLRDRPLGKIAILVAILALAFVASRSCASVGNKISQDEAVAIARQEIDYAPDKVQVRLFKRGFQSAPFWAVSLSTVNGQGQLTRTTVVVIDARSGRVDEVRTAT
jgi:hypothetical protein